MNRRNLLSLVTAGFVFLAAGSCGGPPLLSDELVVLKIIATPSLDGFVRSDGTFSTSGELPLTGDLDAVADGLAVRQFYSFDLSAIPADSTFVNADVGFQLVDHIGSPYDTLGSTRFEWVIYGDSLDGSDYDVPTLVDWGGLIVSGHGTFSGRGLSVTSSVQEDLDSGRGRSQFRVRFQSDSDHDGVSDYVVFTDAELTAGPEWDPPQLVVAFYPPR